MWDQFFSITPMDSEYPKILDIPLHKLGTKRPLHGTLKLNTQIDRQTHIWTFRLIESIGPEGWCFANYYSKTVTAGDLEFWDNVHHPSVSSVPFVTSRVMGCMTSLLQHWSKTGWYFLRQCSPSVCVSCPFTKPPLFQRNRFTCSGNPSFESCVEVKAQKR